MENTINLRRPQVLQETLSARITLFRVRVYRLAGAHYVRYGRNNAQPQYDEELQNHAL